MTGNSSQRRKALRAANGKAKRHGFMKGWPTSTEPMRDTLTPMEWPEPLPEGYRRPTVEEIDALSAASALRSGGKPPKEVIPDTSKPIAPPEPRGEAEGALPHIPTLDNDTTDWVCEKHPHKSWPHWHRGKCCPGPGMLAWKKRRTLWNWLRKLVGR